MNKVGNRCRSSTRTTGIIISHVSTSFGIINTSGHVTRHHQALSGYRHRFNVSGQRNGITTMSSLVNGQMGQGQSTSSVRTATGYVNNTAVASSSSQRSSSVNWYRVRSWVMGSTSHTGANRRRQVTWHRCIITSNNNTVAPARAISHVSTVSGWSGHHNHRIRLTRGQHTMLPSR